MELGLVGRSLELAELTRVMEQAASGHGRGVLLSGEAGIGKSALMEAAIGSAGPLVPLCGYTAGPDETPLLGPWREVAAELQGQLGCSAAPLPAPLGDGPPAASPPELAVALAGWLRAAGRPLLIAFEDLQWADQASLDLLRHLAPRLSRLPVALLGTYRSEEVGPSHPLWQVLPDLQRAGVTTLHLQRLTVEAVAELAASALPAAPGLPGVARYVHQRTGGHPFFLRELLTWYGRIGGLPVEEGPLPETLQQALDRRLARLSPTALAVLQTAAVIGERFPYEVLRRAADHAEPDLQNALDEALACRVLRPEAGGERFAFDHALLRDALAARLQGPRRRQAHARVADALLATPDAERDAIALHLDRAGDPRASRFLMAAGDRSYHLGAHPAARERYERALAHLGPEDPARTELLLRLGHALPSAENERAQTLWLEALTSAEQAGDRPVAVWCRHCLAAQQQSAGAPASLTQLAEVQAEQEALLHDPRYRELEGALFGFDVGYPRAGAVRAWALAKAGKSAEARALLDELYARAAPTSRRLHLLAVEYWITGLYGRLADALEIGARVSRDADRQGDLRTALTVEGNRLYQILLCRANQPDEVDQVAARVTDLLARAGLQAGYDLAAEGYPPLGWYAFLRGDREGARHHLVEYLHRRPDNHDPGVRGLAVQVCLAGGDAAGARALLAGVAPQRPDEEPALHSIQVAAYTTRAGLALLEGDTALARAWLEAGDRLAANRGQPAFRSALKLTWARYHLATGQPAEALNAAGEALTLAEERREFRFLIMTNQVLGEVGALLGRPDAVERLQTAHSLALRCRFPYYADQAAQALERLAPKAGAPSGLTARELEIVRLVAAGLADKEVAAALYISPRTVDAHLRNIFTKLDVTNRTALATLAARHGWTR